MVKIAPVHTAWAAYSACIRHHRALLQLSLGWITLLAGLVLAGMIPWPDLIAWPLLLAKLAAVPIAAAAFVIACCRVVLLDEEPPLLITLRFGARERRCAIHLLGIAALPGVALLLLALLLGTSAWWVPFASLAWLLLIVAPALAASARLAIALPAIAIDEPGELLPAVWRHSRRCGPRLLYGWLLCMLPWLVPSALLFAALDHGATAPSAAPMAELLACPLGFLALAASAAFFAYAFAQLAEGAPAEDAAADARVEPRLV
jgi:hypothetical protein